MLDRYHRENEPNFRPYQAQPPPNFSNHPSVRHQITGDSVVQHDNSRFSPRQPHKVILSPQLPRHHPSQQQPRPTSTRPTPLAPVQQQHITERPHTALAIQSEFVDHNAFERNVPARKSGGILHRLKKSFGKGKSKKPQRLRGGKESTTRHIEISHPTDVTTSLSQSPIHSLHDTEHDFGPHNFHHGKDPPPDIWLSGKQPLNPEIAKPVPRKPPRRSRSKSNSGAIRHLLHTSP